MKDDPSGDAFIALVDGRVVGSAGAGYTDAGLYLGGGSVEKAARGRGVYLGTRALVVQAGEMSRPILERLGFRTVCTIRLFVDDSGA